ncbi:hypothetical protein [Longimicrobium sp.]|uniref:hypothetical protein n=1 Tax=Longimicrobium sp. TaxID=2029185 RepID=UPI002E337BDA|nr:hypothetical protein [Longimicrobium sp.]HEX6038080.1 hypothetical protein [Longimicrobium sp.]
MWFRTDSFSQATQVNWRVDYQAYSSRSEIIPNGQIVASAAYPADLGNTFTIESPRGTGSVTQAGDARAITIHNNVETRFSCGISQKNDAGYAPICALPIFNGFDDVFVPVEKVLLMFATDEVNTGTVILKAYSPAVLVDLTGVTTRTVNYSIDKKWSWGGAPWAHAVAGGEDLVPLLIESSATLEKLRSNTMLERTQPALAAL